MTTNTLSTNIKDIDNCRLQINMQIPYEIYLAEYDSLKKDVTKNLRMPGFRPGKVPDSMVEKKFRSSLEAKATEKVISKSYQDFLKKAERKVFGAPELQEIPKVEPQKEINVTLIVERYPACLTENFSGVKITLNDCKLQPQDIQKAIRSQLRMASKLEDTKDAFAPQFMVKCDIDILSEITDQELKKKIPFQNVIYDATLAENVEELSKDFGFLGLGKDILGLRLGEEKKVTKQIENDFGFPFLQGKKIEFKITVKEIKKIIFPKLDDELLKKWGYQSEKEMQESLTKQYEDLIVLKKKQNREMLLLKELRQKNDFAISEKFIDHVISNTIENEKKQNSEMAKSIAGKPFARIKELYLEKTIGDIKNSLLLNHYLEKNKIEVTEEELNDKIIEIAKRQKKDDEKSLKELRREWIKSGDYTRLKDNIRHEKLLDNILSEGQEIVGKTLSLDEFLEEKVS